MKNSSLVDMRLEFFIFLQINLQVGTALVYLSDIVIELSVKSSDFGI